MFYHTYVFNFNNYTRSPTAASGLGAGLQPQAAACARETPRPRAAAPKRCRQPTTGRGKPRQLNICN